MPRIKVPAALGDEIHIAVNGDPPTTYRVHDGVITVTKADLPGVLWALGLPADTEPAPPAAATAGSPGKES